MWVKIPNIITETARELRKNMTLAEKELWKYLRYDTIGYRFLRQKPLYIYTEDWWLDRFIIPDFYCHEKKLIIEIDGRIHNIHEVRQLDIVKEELVEKQWMRVLRFSNEDIINDLDKVILGIKMELS